MPKVMCLYLDDSGTRNPDRKVAKELTYRDWFTLGGYALWAEATEAIKKYGTMVKAPSGFPIQSPYVSIANRQAEIMMRIASKFGFTPASRSRISTPSAGETPFDLFNQPSKPREH